MRTQEVLDLLRKHRDWMSRAALAAQLGRKRLNQGDLEALAALEATGRIEVDRRPDQRPIGFMVYYRAKSES